jgi:hypothetical protein
MATLPSTQKDQDIQERGQSVQVPAVNFSSPDMLKIVTVLHDTAVSEEKEEEIVAKIKVVLDTKWPLRFTGLSKLHRIRKYVPVLYRIMRQNSSKFLIRLTNRHLQPHLQCFECFSGGLLLSVTAFFKSVALKQLRRWYKL